MSPRLKRFKHYLGAPTAIALVLVMFSNAAMETLFDLLPKASQRLTLIGLLAVLGAALLLRWDVMYQRKTAVRIGRTDESHLAHRKGAIILVGLEAERPEGAVAKLFQKMPHLEHVAFLGTPQTHSRGVVAKIRRQLMPAAGLYVPNENVLVDEDGNPESLEDFYEGVQQAIDKMLRAGLLPEEILLDNSEGRSPMRFGAAMGAHDKRVEVQYLANPWDEAANEPIKDREAFKVMKRFYP